MKSADLPTVLSNLVGRVKVKRLPAVPEGTDRLLAHRAGDRRPASELKKLLLRLAHARDWTAVDELLGNWPSYCNEPLGPLVWQRLLQKLCGLPQFPLYYQRYQEAGHEVGAAVCTMMLVWLVRQKRFKELAGVFSGLREPTSACYRAYVSGLLLGAKNSSALAGELLDEAKGVVLRMLESPHPSAIDRESWTMLMQQLAGSGDIKGAREVWEAAHLAPSQKLDLDLLEGFARRIAGSADFDWLLRQASQLDAEGPASLRQRSKRAEHLKCLILALTQSPFVKRSTGSILSASVRLKVALERPVFHRIAEICGGSAGKALEVLALPWPEADRRTLCQCLLKSGHLGLQTDDPIRVSEHLISASLNTSTPATVKSAASLATGILQAHRRFDFELAGRLLDRLLFFGQHGRAVRLVLGLVRDAGSTASTGMCNRLLKHLNEAGQARVVERLLAILAALPVAPQMQPSIAYGRQLVAMQRDRVRSDDLLTAEQVTAAARSLSKQGRLHRAIAMAEAAKARIGRDPGGLRILLPVHLELLGRSPQGREGMLAVLEEMASIWPGAEPLCTYGITLLSRPWEAPEDPPPLGSCPPALATCIANSLLQSTSLFRGLPLALHVWQQLFPTVARPDLSTYKILAHAYLQAEDKSTTTLPMQLLEEAVDHGLRPDTDLYSILVEYAALGLHSLDQVNALLHHMLAAGGIPTTRIFTHLFAWLRDQPTDAPETRQGALDLLAMAHRCHVPPPAIAYDCLAHLALTADTGEGDGTAQARAWIVEAAGQPYGRSRCSEPIISAYLARLDPSAVLDEAIALLRLGYGLPSDLQLRALEHSMSQGDSRAAKLLFARLAFKDKESAVVRAKDLAEILLQAGDLASAYQAFEHVEDKSCSFSEWLDTRLREHPNILESGELRPPPLGQPIGPMVTALLAHIHRHAPKVNLPSAWCQAALHSLLLQADLETARPLGVYMVAKGVPWPPKMAEQTAVFWKKQLRIAAMQHWTKRKQIHIM